MLYKYSIQCSNVMRVHILVYMYVYIIIVPVVKWRIVVEKWEVFIWAIMINNNNNNNNNRL